MLIGAVTLFAMLFAWVRIQELHRLAIVNEIELHNGSNVYKDPSLLTFLPTLRIETVSLPHDALCDFDAAKLRRFPGLEKIELTNFNAHNESGVGFHADKMTFDVPKYGDFFSRLEPKVETQQAR